MSSKQPTIRDIANALGVHFTTVGKALNNNPRISEKTRKKVFKQAREMGYRPNPLVSALMAHKGATAEKKGLSKIAIITASRTALRFQAVAITKRGIENRANALGYEVEVFPLEEYQHSLAFVCRTLKARGIASIILLAVSEEDIADYSLFNDFCVVSAHLSFGPVPAVMVDHFQCIELLCQKIYDLGYKKPALIISPSLEPAGMKRTVAGFMLSMENLFGRKNAPIILEQDCDETQLSAWLKKNKPDILIESWRGIRLSEMDLDESAWKRWVKRYRPELIDSRRSGRSLKAINSILSKYPYVILDCIAKDEVGIHQNRSFVGRKAVDYLSASLNRNERGIPQQTHRLLVEGSVQLKE